MATDVEVPTLGESITEATLGEWLKQPGDAVGRDEPIASLETDKVAVEVPSPIAGILEEQLVAVGDTIEVGAVIARIGESGGAAKAAPAEKSPEPEAADENEEGEGDDETQAHSSALTLSPAVRRAVLEHGVDPSKIKGSGKDGRLTKDDVLKAAKEQDAEPHSPSLERTDPPAESAQAKAPKAAPKATGDGERTEERVRMSRLRQTIASRLKEAQNTAALLTTFNDVDMSAVMDARKQYKELFEKKHGIRLGFMGFFVKAACLALRDVPSVNGRIDGDEIVYHDYVDVSVAVSAPSGLVVPVIRNAESMSFAEIETTIADFGQRAKDGKLSMDEMKGGTFTISNGGVFGSLLSTPIINPPQSAVLGMHRIEQRPVVLDDGSIVARPMMYLALSYDHRLVDGREAVTALVRMKEALEDPMRLLIDL
ncbi:MAG: 2-oxoglutarate dehydrogenase complex dihydrolipoyllysine-residue succinyltransferase [Sphingomonadaceae bacterium]|nr:2-oxoglutarate dehydrogenase complex dihydrolipoyllysine-residue succinyltransferase [Sphingomonadaceae bacterium]